MVLELTEHALIEEEAASEALNRLHEAGAAIAIDDFGVGYSSISYLHRFRCIDALKIDRSFVGSIVDDDRTHALVDSVIAMARAFDAIVVAEGIEDWETFATIQSMRCSLGQGFLFGRPSTFETAMEFARAGGIRPIGSQLTASS